MLKKKKVILGLICMALFCCTGCQKEDGASFQPLELEENTETETAAEDTQEEPEDTEETPGQDAGGEEICVYVCGAVNAPGVYQLKAGARLYEAVACAGGMREDAAAEAVNQARPLSDGEQIYIPTEEEAADLPAEVQSGGQQGGQDSGTGKVNINTASKEELTTLSGIGDTRAESIIRYREEHGPFESIEDLMQVEGIKEGVFQKIKDQITVQ